MGFIKFRTTRFFAFFLFTFIMGNTLDQVTSQDFQFQQNNNIGFKNSSFLRSVEVTKSLPTPKPLAQPPWNIHVPRGLEFSCKDKPVAGYFTDPSPSSLCQVYHLCLPDGRQYTMMCGIGTVFNQRSLVCDHWYNYRCSPEQVDKDYQFILQEYLLDEEEQREEDESIFEDESNGDIQS